MSTRYSSVAGSFYPENCSEIERYIEHFNKVIDDTSYTFETGFAPQALISPHAGYIYSGFTANLAYRAVSQNNKNIRRVVVIGPSHRAYIRGASVGLYDTYQTPCGDLKVDLDYSLELEKKFGFLHFSPEAHFEHSTETQMPFIAHYFSDIEVVEIVYAEISPQEVSELIDELLRDEKNLVVISTDLSHFYTKEKAQTLDDICLDAIANLDLHRIDQGCEACGMIGVKAMIESAVKAGMKSTVLDYRTSADSSGDESNVVGYTSAVFGK